MDAEDYQQIEETDMSHWHSFFGVNSTNKNQRDKLRKLSRKYIMETLAEQLDRNLSEMGISGYTIERVTSTDSGTPIDSDKDPTVILVNYESVCNDRVGYILPRMKVEISCLSMSEPSEEMPRSLRMSRHLYDMYLLKDTGFGREALTDTDLYETIVKHRSLYYVDKRVDYNRHHPSLINFCPPDKVVDAWKSDYANMLESFIYGKAPSFDELMESMKSLLDDFRRVKVKDNILE